MNSYYTYNWQILASCDNPRTWSGGPGGPQLGDDHVEDGDEEEGVGGEQEEDGHDVDPLRARLLDEGTARPAGSSSSNDDLKHIKNVKKFIIRS